MADNKSLYNDSDVLAQLKELNSSKMAITEALLEEQGLMPDVDDEWRRLKGKHNQRLEIQTIRRKSYLMGVLSGVAAMLACAIILGAFWMRTDHDTSVLTYSSQPTNGQITLQQGDADVVVLDVLSELNLEQGILSGNDDSLSLNYAQLSEVPLASALVSEMQTVCTPPGRDINITLADGTSVFLNANSKLTFPSQFSGSSRNVELVGEAYFCVAHDASAPFIVKGNGFQTQVLGTEFYMTSVENEPSFVALIEGSVRVHNQLTGTQDKLTPGQCYTLGNDGKASIKEIDTQVFTYWRDGYFYFDNIPLSDVMQAIGRSYNVNIVFEDENLMNLKLRFFCNRHGTIDEAISRLNRLNRIHAKVIDNTIYLK